MKAPPLKLFFKLNWPLSHNLHFLSILPSLSISKIKDPRLSFNKSSTSLVLYSLTIEIFKLKSFQKCSKTFIQSSLPEVISSNWSSSLAVKS